MATPFPVAFWRPDPVGQPLHYALYAEVPHDFVGGNVPAGTPRVLGIGMPKTLLLPAHEEPAVLSVTTSFIAAAPGTPVAPAGPAAGLPFVAAGVQTGSASLGGASRIDARFAVDLAAAPWTPDVPSPTVLGGGSEAAVVGGSALLVVPQKTVLLRIDFTVPAPPEPEPADPAPEPPAPVGP